MSQQTPKKNASPITRLLMLLVAVIVAGGSAFGIFASPEKDVPAGTAIVEKDGWYSDKVHVAAYIAEYDTLPGNYLTKSQAEKLGWDSSKGNLWDVAPGKSIGGDVFGNYEGLLPRQSGRTYYECDIDYDGGYRNAKRIIFSSDGLIYYTEDHYETFEDLTTHD